MPVRRPVRRTDGSRSEEKKEKKKRAPHPCGAKTVSLINTNKIGGKKEGLRGSLVRFSGVIKMVLFSIKPPKIVL